MLLVSPYHFCSDSLTSGRSFEPGISYNSKGCCLICKKLAFDTSLHITYVPDAIAVALVCVLILPEAEELDWDDNTKRVLGIFENNRLVGKDIDFFDVFDAIRFKPRDMVKFALNGKLRDTDVFHFFDADIFRTAVRNALDDHVEFT
jgi:hypothetical protein